MARKSQPRFEGIDSYIFSGAERAMDNSMANDPGSLAYSYGELDKKYPVSSTRKLQPESIQYEIDEQELERKTAEIAYKEKQYRMQLMDSQLNRENARLTQAPLIRKELSTLNPQSDDFQDKLIDIYQRNPIGYEDEALQNYIVKPLLNTHNQYIQNKNYMDRMGGKIPSSKDVSDAAYKIMDYEDLIAKAQKGEIDDITKQKYKPLSSAELMDYNFNKSIMQRAQSSYQGAGDQQGTMQPQQAQQQFDPDIQQAMMVIQRFPNKKDEVNKRLISAGKQPIP
jgi:hypothetical protein